MTLAVICRTISTLGRPDWMGILCTHESVHMILQSHHLPHVAHMGPRVRLPVIEGEPRWYELFRGIHPLYLPGKWSLEPKLTPFCANATG